MLEKLGEAFLWPGTRICKAFGIQPKDELGLLRSYFNFLFWLPVGLVVIYIFY